MDPFLLFPEEVWEMILHNLEDSKDIGNVFRALPQLDMNGTLQKKKHVWLFGLVLPHLIPWKCTSKAKEKQLLSYRLVCRHWSAAVDNFLENQLQLRAYNPETELEQPGTFQWNAKTYLEKNAEDEEGSSFEVRFRTRDPYGGVKFSYYDLENYEDSKLPRFLKEMEKCPPERNPFLSRSLTLSLPREFGDDDLQMDAFWENLITLHKRFAKHIWHYKISFYKHDLDPSFITEAFGRLTNLRSLCIKIEDDIPVVPLVFGLLNIDQLVELIDRSLPPLQNLETLRIKDPNHQLRRFLITRFSPKVRKLQMQVRSWKNEYSRLFPNLTELELSAVNPNDISKLRGLLQTLEAPQLAKLQLELYTSNMFCMADDTASLDFSIEEDVFKWLKRFPRLSYLEFGEGCRIVRFKEKGSLCPETDSIPSLQFLSIRTSLKMSYNFLRCLPSLQYLHLYVHSKPVVEDNSASPTVRIREELQTANMYKSNVWTLLPKLKEVTLLKDVFIHPEIWEKWEFSREGYESQRRIGFPCSDGDHYAPLRKDVAFFLKPKRERNAYNYVHGDKAEGGGEDEDSDEEDSYDDDDGSGGDDDDSEEGGSEDDDVEDALDEDDDEADGDYGGWPIF